MLTTQEPAHKVKTPDLFLDYPKPSSISDYVWSLNQVSGQPQLFYLQYILSCRNVTLAQCAASQFLLIGNILTVEAGVTTPGTKVIVRPVIDGAISYQLWRLGEGNRIESAANPDLVLDMKEVIYSDVIVNSKKDSADQHCSQRWRLLCDGKIPK